MTVNGKYVIVELVAHELLDKAVKVYNFEVKDYHTYFVASNINAARDAFVLVHNKCVAKEGSYRADVRLGGDPNHALGHAHIYNGSKNITSVDVSGNVLAGSLDKGGKDFVKKYLGQIAKGIKKFY